jgi:hypothetical protein
LKKGDIGSVPSSVSRGFSLIKEKAGEVKYPGMQAAQGQCFLFQTACCVEKPGRVTLRDMFLTAQRLRKDF